MGTKLAYREMFHTVSLIVTMVGIVSPLVLVAVVCSLVSTWARRTDRPPMMDHVESAVGDPLRHQEASM